MSYLPNCLRKPTNWAEKVRALLNDAKAGQGLESSQGISRKEIKARDKLKVAGRLRYFDRSKGQTPSRWFENSNDFRPTPVFHDHASKITIFSTWDQVSHQNMSAAILISFKFGCFVCYFFQTERLLISAMIEYSVWPLDIWSSLWNNEEEWR